MSKNDTNKNRPPYIPWETFKTFLKTLKDSAVPNRIDSSMMPTTMSGFSKAGITTTLVFFSLIDSDGRTESSLNEIVEAFETDNWAETIKKILLPAYQKIIGGIKLDSATRKELDEKFGDTSSQAMKDKFVRFFIPMLTEAGITVSPFLTQRQSRPRKSGPRKTRKKQKKETAQNENAGEGTTQTSPNKAPDHMFDLPMMGIDGGFIRIPKKLTPELVSIVKAAAEYLAATVAAQKNKESK